VELDTGLLGSVLSVGIDLAILPIGK
jgi:hypothetical protein